MVHIELKQTSLGYWQVQKLIEVVRRHVFVLIRTTAVGDWLVG